MKSSIARLLRIVIPGSLLSVGTLSASPYNEAVLADAPVLYYPFDESGGLVIADASGGGNDGTVTGPLGFGAETFHPNLGTALDFDGVRSRIDVPALGTFPQSSVEVWINIRGIAGGCCTSIYSTDSFGGGNLHFNLKTGRDVEHAIAGGGPNNNNSPAGSIQDGIWYHVVATYDTAAAGETKFYLDGVEVATGAHGAAPVMSLVTAEIGAWNGSRFFIGLMDEFALYDSILSPERVQAHYDAATAAASAFAFKVTANGSDLVLTWESRDGFLYNLRSETDPSLTAPLDWPVFDGNENLAATPPENTLTIPRPADPRRFFVVEQFPAPPVSVFSDDFEGGQGAWTTGSDGSPGTEWQLGTPTLVGPSSANSPDNCFGTNIAADYAEDANVWLRSPPIDLTTVGAATLRYFEWRDIEITFDVGSVKILDAADDSEIAELRSAIDGQSTGWEEVSAALPAEALGKTIRIEFRFDTDEFMNLAGWYIDDVKVTVP